jgi:hypothetical protein
LVLFHDSFLLSSSFQHVIQVLKIENIFFQCQLKWKYVKCTLRFCVSISTWILLLTSPFMPMTHSRPSVTGSLQIIM